MLTVLPYYKNSSSSCPLTHYRRPEQVFDDIRCRNGRVVTGSLDAGRSKHRLQHNPPTIT